MAKALSDNSPLNLSIHYPINTALSYRNLNKRQAQLTADNLLHPKSGRPIADLLNQLSNDDYDVQGAIIEYDALRHRLKDYDGCIKTLRSTLGALKDATHCLGQGDNTVFEAVAEVRRLSAG